MSSPKSHGQNKKRLVRKSYFAKITDYLYADIVDWSAGRMWQGRALLLCGLAYIAIQHLINPLYSDPFKGFNLAIHEMGHYIFAPFGMTMNVLGGSLFQCLVPLASIPMFFKQRDYFAIAVAFGWLSTNLFDVAIYAADARAQELPLVSPGMGGDSGEIIHDWNWLLSNAHLLAHDHDIARFFAFWAVVSMLICLLMGSWICWLMHKQKSAKPKL